VSLLFALLLSLSIGTPNARDADVAPRTFAVARTARQKCINTCRARYRDCRRLNQVPRFECRGVYQDCTRYTCTGLRGGCPTCLLPPSPAMPARSSEADAPLILLHLLTSGHDTNTKCLDVRFTAAFGGIAELTQTRL